MPYTKNKHPGRGRGEDNEWAKLTADDVREIRFLYETSEVTYADLAEQFDTTAANIGAIVRRESWRHIE